MVVSPIGLRRDFALESLILMKTTAGTTDLVHPTPIANQPMGGRYPSFMAFEEKPKVKPTLLVHCAWMLRLENVFTKSYSLSRRGAESNRGEGFGKRGVRPFGVAVGQIQMAPVFFGAPSHPVP